MIGDIKTFYEKHKLVLRYLLFGLITTVLSLAACYFTLKIGVLFIHDENGEPTELLDVIGSTTQWVVGVLVAFFTNKLWVFKNARHGFVESLRQFGLFSASRVGTYFLEVVMNLVFIKIFAVFGYKTITLGLFGIDFDLTSRLWAKIIASVFVVISNYYISKLVIFRKKNGSEAEKDTDKVQ